MAGRFSDTDIAQIMNYRFGMVTAAPPSTHWVGLSTTAPTASGGNITEVSGFSYARVQILNNTTSWPTVTGRNPKVNGVPVTFPTATGSWGTPTYFVLFDASSAGVMRAYGVINNPIEILSGATPSFPVGALSITAPSS